MYTVEGAYRILKFRIIFITAEKWKGWSLGRRAYAGGWGRRSSGGGAPMASVFRRVDRETLDYTLRDPKR